MTTDDQRFTLREAADLTGMSVDTLRRRVKNRRVHRRVRGHHRREIDAAARRRRRGPG